MHAVLLALGGSLTKRVVFIMIDVKIASTTTFNFRSASFCNTKRLLILVKSFAFGYSFT